MRNLKSRAIAAIGIAALTLCASGGSLFAQSTAAPKFSDDGSIEAPAFTLPYSAFASPEAKAAFIAKQHASNPFEGVSNPSPEDFRRIIDDNFTRPIIARQNARYPVTYEEKTIDGVFVQVFKPREGVSTRNRHRVLINLHGGGFFSGARTQSQVESIPIAAVGKITVVSVDYRQGPENVFPAASEDVATIYRYLLKTHKPSEIGIYGCSAGGMLTAETIPWLLKEGLPLPAAIGVLCSSTGLPYDGDSAHITPRLGGFLPAADAAPETPPTEGYLKGVSFSDPLAWPGRHPEVLKKFPPTLLMTGTRAGEMSSVLRTHLDLVKAGVHAELYVWDGMDHGFMADPDLPESHEAYDILTAFFDKRMDEAQR